MNKASIINLLQYELYKAREFYNEFHDIEGVQLDNASDYEAGYSGGYVNAIADILRLIEEGNGV